MAVRNLDTVNLFFAMALVLLCLLPSGCSERRAVIVYGNITYGGEKMPLSGRVIFVPIEDTSGPNCSAMVVDGQYRIDALGGIPVGKYRVVVDVRKKTGRKVAGRNPLEPGPATQVDETVRVSPDIYLGDQSPVVVEVRSDFNGRFDIAIPRCSER